MTRKSNKKKHKDILKDTQKPISDKDMDCWVYGEDTVSDEEDRDTKFPKNPPKQ